MENKILKAALEYKSLGWSVVPAKVGTIANGKAQKTFPIRWGEFQERIASEEEINNWYTDHPDWGIAVICGSISGVAVLDVDDMSIDLAKYNLPSTWVVKTGRGMHYYFKLPKDKNIQGTILLEKGLELKGNGSTVHAPPTKYSGNINYEWLSKDGEMAELPESVWNAIPERKESEGMQLYKTEGKIQEGEGRNNAATSYVGYLFKKTPRALWKELCWPALKQWNVDHCNPQLSEKDLGIIFNSIAKKENKPAAEPKEPIKPVSHKELMAMEFPELKWLVKDLVPAEAITIISGAPEGFKSWITLEIANKSVKQGLVFNKFESHSEGCLIIDEENGLRLLQERMKVLGKKEDLNLHYLAYAGLKITEEDIGEIMITLKERGLKTVIFDSFVRFLNGADENSASEIAKIFGYLKGLVKEGITVVLIHHHRKEGLIKAVGGQQMRGSSDILASVNCHIIVEKKEDELIITPNKLREAEKIKPFKVSVIKNSDPKGIKFEWKEELDEDVNKVDDAKSDIKEVLFNQNKPISTKELMDILSSGGINCSRHTVVRALAFLVESEEIRWTKMSGNGNTRFYTLAENDQNEEENSGGDFEGQTLDF